ncbi:alanyl-tRNA synthetase [Ruminococcus sp. YE71]|uniref:alanine--tRNA ligase n=1 Tax=unclassified Ruminococcus TaxID=2608920 RepID=UPI00088F66A3|nr:MULTISPECIES: alanine--tRNA ligase [unclassified Ruminococcus]SDA15830.1 alanyl-tRNA synthetase [Ruminococcus sp. YE78]SFW23262.1 alanyl-tRNA synthetase [Ruminococcus sp. YE71]
MEWTSLNDLRESYLKFFESKNCLRKKSYSLVPQNDNSLLLIVAGMAPLKPYFTGQEVPPRTRMTTCQKCIRTGDIENVGKTARHGTYFEMLGNFSFGDYFKKEAITWAWEYVTEVLKLPKDRLWISVYEDDDEAEQLWQSEAGVPADRIVRMGKEDNFWEAGTDGPCGPCSEIYFDRGVEYGCGKPDCKVGCDCDRFMEFWNLVFTQFERHEDGTYTPLAQKNIDTGMGLERLAALMQGVDSIFDVDTVKAIRDHICRIAGCEYGKEYKKDVSVRVITDHIRAVTFLASDGVLPSNEGAGYVMRRLVRRAVRHGKLLGIEGMFLKDIVRTVVDCNKCEYNELEEKYDYIVKVLTNEELNFNRTIDRGMKLLDDLIADMQANGKTVLGGEDCFKLSDTYGFPLDLTREILEEKGFTADEEGYEKCMEVQRTTAREARGGSKYMGADETVFHRIDKEFHSDFLGYGQLEADSTVDFIANDDELIMRADEGQTAYIVSKATPFYAESGGQVGDTGIITTATGKAEVTDTQKAVAGKIAHTVKVVEGHIEAGQAAHFAVDAKRRMAIARNHTSAHLLQAALREVLGDHVHQKGQLVDADRVRFDFSHFEAITPDELAKVEALVNEKIMDCLPVDTREMPIEEAQKLGAMALFGEKYGETVRVVSIGDFSLEFCGGTHLTNASQAGLFRIISESSVASGVRRIEAVTGANVLKLLAELDGKLANAAKTLKVNDVNLIGDRIAAVLEENKELSRSVDSLKGKIAGAMFGSVVSAAQDVKGVKLAAVKLDSVGADMYDSFADGVKSMDEAFVLLLAGTADEKPKLLCVCSKAAVSAGAHAGKLVKEAAAITGGKGGGRPDQAMAGVGDAAKIDEAMAKAAELLGGFIK